MAKALLGKKIGMTQIFDERGSRIGVTVVELGPCVITQIKTQDKDGYNAIQVGLDDKKNANKTELGHAAKANTAPKRFIREFRIEADEVEQYQLGQSLNVDIFEEVKKVKITGTSIGKGFAGVMKRHNFKGAQTMSHGTHEAFRHGGSIGQCVNPGRVYKGKKMAGQMGNKRVTSRGVKVIKTMPEENLILLEGSVPGSKNSYCILEAA